VVIHCKMAWGKVTTTPPPPLTSTMTTLPASYSLLFITLSIASFGISAFTYRLTCADCPKSIKNYVLFQTLVLVLPEILTNTVIVNLFILGNNDAALFALHCGSQILCAVALVGTICFLFSSNKRLQVERREEVESIHQVGTLPV
jgi:hypothetical protein